jgi:translation initiation factor 2B subunit (eIF-2B alpha/beta/delta family)
MGIAVLHSICSSFFMENPRSAAQLRIMELNRQFLQEVGSGKGWKDVRHLMEEMKEVAKQLDHIPATVVSFDNYILNNKESESAESPGI